jgi:hypothetical protein
VSLNLAPWWDEPDYKTCNTFHLRGLFILRKLREHDSTKFHDVITVDLYGHFVPGGDRYSSIASAIMSPLLRQGVYQRRRAWLA